jgi:hypothetical protein
MGANGVTLPVIVRLHPDDVETVARRVVELQRAESVPEGGENDYATHARTLATRYGVTPEWVRYNARKLGGVPLGDGPRPRWRFNVAVADGRIAAMRALSDPSEPPPAEKSKPRGRKRQTDTQDTKLLPIKGKQT